MQLVPKRIADLLPGDKIHEITEGSPPHKLPFTVLSWDPATCGLKFRAYRGKTDLHITLNPALNVRVARRHRPKIVENPERLFEIKNKLTGEVLQAKEMTTRGPTGERLFRIQFARDLWSDSYTDLRFQATLGTRWEIIA